MYVDLGWQGNGWFVCSLGTNAVNHRLNTSESPMRLSTL